MTMGKYSYPTSLLTKYTTVQMFGVIKLKEITTFVRHECINFGKNDGKIFRMLPKISILNKSDSFELLKY